MADLTIPFINNIFNFDVIEKKTLKYNLKKKRYHLQIFI